MNLQHLLRDSVLYPLLGLRTVVTVELFFRTRTRRGWAAIIGLFTAGAVALTLDRSFEAVTQHGWRSWMVWSAVYGAGMVVTFALIFLFEAIGWLFADEVS